MAFSDGIYYIINSIEKNLIDKIHDMGYEDNHEIVVMIKEYMGTLKKAAKKGDSDD